MALFATLWYYVDSSPTNYVGGGGINFKLHIGLVGRLTAIVAVYKNRMTINVKAHFYMIIAQHV